MTHAIRQADPDDLVAVMRLFDGALLETDTERIRQQLTGGNGCILLAAVADRPVGAVAMTTKDVADRPAEWDDAVHITEIAVTTARQNQGLGRSLIEAAAEWATPHSLTATFEAAVRPFYTACGFEIDGYEGRLWGIRPPAGVE